MRPIVVHLTRQVMESRVWELSVHYQTLGLERPVVPAVRQVIGFMARRNRDRTLAWRVSCSRGGASGHMFDRWRARAAESRWDRAARVERWMTRGRRSATGRWPGASGHYDRRVRSCRKTPSEGVTAILALRAINRSLSRPLADS